MTPYGDMELGQHWLRLWLGAVRQQVVAWTNADLSSVRSHCIHLGALSLGDLKKPINKTRLKIAVLKWHPGLPGANEFIFKLTSRIDILSISCETAFGWMSYWWFRQRLGAVRQQAITWTIIDYNPWSHMASLGLCVSRLCVNRGRFSSHGPCKLLTDS